MDREVMAKAKEQAEEWIKTLDFDGRGEEEEILELLEDGSMTLRIIVRTPRQAADAVEMGVDFINIYNGGRMPDVDIPFTNNFSTIRSMMEKNLDPTGTKIPQTSVRDIRPWNCIWDYYHGAFWEAAYKLAPNDESIAEKYARNEPIFPAFEAKMGFLVRLGALEVGILLPEAHRDDRGRLHREDGPALVWDESDMQYWWHGVEVEENWILHPEEVKQEEFWGERNAEKRRALSEICGWAKFITEDRVEVLHEDKTGELLSVSLVPGTTSRFVRVVCSTTGRIYVLGVPQEIERAKQGVAWTFGLTEDQYSPIHET